MKAFAWLAIASAAVALGSGPAAAKPKDPAQLGCTQQQNGQCTGWAELTSKQAIAVRRNDVFGANYPYYLKVTDLPEDIAREYDLDIRSLYVATSNGYIFVVDPEGYWVTRVIAPERATER